MTIAVAPLANALGNFESADGDMVVNSTRDWASLVGLVTIAEDKPTGGGDDSLGMGSKDDLSEAAVTDGAIPNNKSDLDRFYSYSSRVDGKDYLYLAWTRNNTLGTANMSIELNALKQTPPASGKWVINRLPGDALILFDFAQGGKTSGVKLGLSRWVTSGDPRKVCQANSSVPCWGKVTSLGSAIADGQVNLKAITDPLNGGKALPELTFGEASINLTDAKLVTNACSGFASAMIRSRSSAAFDSELKDFIAPVGIAIQRPGDPTGAVASGNATAVRINGTVYPAGNTASSKVTGPGTDGDSKSAATVAVPPSGSTAGSLAEVSLLPATASSSVSSAGADQASQAAVASVDLLDGLITAGVVRAHAHTVATKETAAYDVNGSGITGLKINGVAQVGVAPNSLIDLDPKVFGAGSYIKVGALGPGVDPNNGGGFGTASGPASVGQSGKFKADVVVRGLEVRVTGYKPSLLEQLLGAKEVPALDAVISEAVAHSDFNGIRCHDNTVGAHAYNAYVKAEGLPLVNGGLVNYTSIPSLGGDQAAAVNTVNVVNGLVKLSTIGSESHGFVREDDAVGSSSWGSAHVESISLLNGLITAGVLDVRSESTAKTGTVGSTGNFNLVGLKIAGQAVAVPAPGVPIVIPGVGRLYVNERTCDGGASLPSCVSGKSAGMTVRGLHVYVDLLNTLGLAPSTEIIVGEAYSRANY